MGEDGALNTTIRRGSKGEAVSRLQALLLTNLIPPHNITVDGDFGGMTDAAVRAFQTQRGLVSDGVVGPATWTALGQSIGVPPPLVTSPPVTDDENYHPVRTEYLGWLDLAKAELGVSEHSLPGQHNARIVAYHATTSLGAGQTDETPWCSSFVNWVMIQAGHTGTNNALAKSWLTWGRKLTTPEPGAITIVRKKGEPTLADGTPTGYHVAFYMSSTWSRIRLLGGNQSNQVKESDYYLSAWELLDYRMP